MFICHHVLTPSTMHAAPNNARKLPGGRREGCREREDGDAQGSRGEQSPPRYGDQGHRHRKGGGLMGGAS